MQSVYPMDTIRLFVVEVTSIVPIGRDYDRSKEREAVLSCTGLASISLFTGWRIGDRKGDLNLINQAIALANRG